MDPAILRGLFLSVFAFGVALEYALDFLNRREIARHPGLPGRLTRPPFAGRFTPETYARSRAYSLARLRFAGIERMAAAVFLLLLLFSGALPAYDGLLARFFGEGLSRGVFFLGGIALAQGLFQLPFAAWSAFVIEGRFGFNTLTWGQFRRDAIRGFLLSAALGLPLLYALMAFLRFAGTAWWLWVFVLFSLWQALLVFAYPAFIAPLFNRFAPLPEGDLRRTILSLADRLGFPAAGIFVMDGSRRSLHGNAYFTGFGRFRRIVLFDTLLRQLEAAEIEAVLAHEIGHYKLKHIVRLLPAQAAFLALLLYLASLALGHPALYRAFGFAVEASATAFSGPPAPGLFLFFTLFSAVAPFFAPVTNFLSRRHEYQADAYAVKAVGGVSAMQSALIKLSGHSLGNLTPHPWYSAFRYSHPTLIERVEAMEGNTP